jgi:hypothetical protein
VNPRNPLIVASLALGVLALAPNPVGAAVDPPSPATGHAAVVTQGVVDFAEGAFSWQLTTVPVTSAPTPLDASAPAFVLSSGAAAVVVDGDAGPVARLAPGEAVFRPAGAPTALHTAAPAGATAVIVSAAAGAGDGSATFTPGASTRDVDLVRDVLNTNEALVLRAEVSALVVVTAGEVSAGGVPVTAGSSTAITGDVTLINTAGQPATVFVAVIGATLGDVAEPAATAPTDTQAPAATNAPAAPPAPAPEDPPATDAPPETEPAPPATEPEPEPELDPMGDADGDGLLNSDEAGFGSDPFDSDTDNDGLTDGVDRGNGCNPTSYDTDGDGFSDGSEVNAGTNCAVPNNG